MANIFDLTGTYVASNYRRVQPSTQFGTRVLRFIKVSVASGPDLVSGADLSDSYFSKAVLCMQNYGETWMIGTPADMGGGVYAFVMVVSDDTAQDAEVDSNTIGGAGSASYGQAEANVAAALGSGTVTISYGSFAGGTLNWSATTNTSN